jgi:hypothetical protein
MNVPDQATFEAGIQLPLYACGLAFGKLVRVERCERCAGMRPWRCLSCGGADLYPRGVDPIPCTTCEQRTEQKYEPCEDCNGRGKVEHLEPWPILENAQEFELAEIYPAYLWDTGLAQRVTTISRADLLDWQLALGATLNRVEHAFETGRWDAMPGKPQCDECPAKWACPLPPRVRDFAGAINTQEEAIEAALWWEFHHGKPAAVKKELKAFAGRPGGGPIRYGSNLILDFQTNPKRKVDTDGLIAAANERAERGTPFNPDDFITVTHSLNFDRRVLSEEELREEGTNGSADTTAGAESVGAEGRAGAHPFGDEAPF